MEGRSLMASLCHFNSSLYCLNHSLHNLLLSLLCVEFPAAAVQNIHRLMRQETELYRLKHVEILTHTERETGEERGVSCSHGVGPGFNLLATRFSTQSYTVLHTNRVIDFLCSQRRRGFPGKGGNERQGERGRLWI